MVAAGVRAFLVNRAPARCAVDINAVIVSLARQREDGVLEVKVVNNASLHQPLGDFFWRFIGFKGIYDLHANQVFGSHLHRQGAASGLAVLAEVFFELNPGGGFVDINTLVVSAFHRND